MAGQNQTQMTQPDGKTSIGAVSGPAIATATGQNFDSAYESTDSTDATGDTGATEDVVDETVVETAGDGDGDGDVESTSDGEGEGGGEGQVAGSSAQAKAKPTDAEIQTLMSERAKAMGIDTAKATKRELELLKSLANQDWFINRAKSGQAGDGEGDGSGDGDDGSIELSDEELNRVLWGDSKADDGEEGAVDAKPGEEKPGKEGDKGDSGSPFPFKNGRDWLKQIGDAAEAGDQDRLVDLHSDFVVANLMAARPLLNSWIKEAAEEMLRERLGDALPTIKKVTAQSRTSEARETALTRLESTAQFKDVRSMLAPDGGPPIVLNGRSYQSTPLHKVLKSNPELLNIRIDGKDGKVDYAATQAQIMMAAYKRWKAPSDRRSAEAALKTGMRIGEKTATQAEKNKVAGSSGGKTTKPAAPSKPQGEGNYGEELLKGYRERNTLRL